MKTAVKKRRKRMTKKEKESNTARILKIAEDNNITIINATLRFAAEEDITPERVLSRVSSQLIERLKEEARQDDTKYYIHKHSEKTNNKLDL